MPRVSRIKARHHASAVPRGKQRLVDSQPTGDEDVDHGQHADEGARAGPSSLAEQVEASLQAQPYSKSHARRLKRKAKQTLIGGELGGIAAALSHSLDEPIREDEAPRIRTTEERKAEREEAKRQAAESRKIAEGKGRTMGEKARRNQIAKEGRRIPLIMSHPAYKADPWATIRLHANNSLAQVVKR